jgi:hypothetical protein
MRCRADLVTTFFSGLVDRKDALTDVLRALDRETVACVAQRLGYCNVYNAARPSLFYRLRMWRNDDRTVAYRLARLAARSEAPCFKFFALNGEARKVSEGNSVGERWHRSCTSCCIETLIAGMPDSIAAVRKTARHMS